MFPNQIILEHTKVLNTEKYKLRLKQIMEYIFNLKIDVATTMRKYFKTIYISQDIDTNKNTCFFNFRAEKNK